MSNVYFTELKRYNFYEIQKELENANEDIIINREKVQHMIRKLQECQIVKAISFSSTEQSVSVNNSDEVLGNKFGDDIRYVFDYVGIIVFSDYVIKCFPKYISIPKDKSKEKKEELENKFKEVIQVIENYNRNHAKRKRYFNLTDGRGGIISNEIALKLFLLREYYQRGLYRVEREIIEDNGAGEILWEETLETPGYYKNGKVFHIPLKTLKVEDDESYFTDLHRCVLTEISKEFNNNELLDVFNISPVFLSNLSLDRFDKPGHIKNMLKREQRVQFVTWKQNLLCALYAYISEEKTDNISDHIELFGTNCFNLVWEAVCKSVFDNQLEKSLTVLPGCYLKGAKKTLAEIIDHPLWYNHNYNKCAIAESTFKPDIIGIFKKEERGFELWIFDAKYYVFDFKEENGRYKIMNQPGVEDIAKQYLYELVLKDFSDSQNYVAAHNVFLCPHDADTIIFGYAEIAFLKHLTDIRMKQINIIKLNATKMYEIYLSEIGADNAKNRIIEDLRKRLKS
ncbi:MAG: LlaJI family restriction endonuclease [Elusimicrobia bacterium]|nr:LlaJI family restriction endonuclease [Elusimicrobiota bacterium]